MRGPYALPMTNVVLNEVEARLLGVLIEKQITTPDQYPLSIKALMTGSNQKSNRHPVVSLSEAEVVVGTQGLEAKGLATRVPPGMGARVERFEHHADRVLELGPAQIAVVAELLLRGPQQPGELRTRANRMHGFDTLADLGHVLERLIARKLVKRLAPSPGTRAERYRELLSSPAADRVGGSSEPAAAPRPTTPEEVLVLHDSLATERDAAQREPVRSGSEGPESVAGDDELGLRVAALEARVEALERLLAARARGGPDFQA